MCGISGAIGWIDPTIVDAVGRMSDALVHRGPDDHGVWRSTTEGAGAVFSFRRLSIQDLSVEAHQPMVDANRGNVIVFNGEIYNFRELACELQRHGESLRSTGDTEVLLKAYGRWGVEALHRLRGMFAFAIWDVRQRRVLLARDRIGIKPLYYCTIDLPEHRKVVLFGSELRSILASGLVQRKLNQAGLTSYLWNGFVAGPDTIIQGIQLLGAGRTLAIDAEGRMQDAKRYWQLPGAAPTPDGEEQLEHELSTAIQQHLISDVPLGVFLSGGIDSSAVTALAVRCSGAQVRTFNVSFDEAKYDESPHARAVATALGTQHTEVRLTHDLFRENLDAALSSIDQPTFDAVNTYFVSRAVREAGITVALAGTGGDELFGGYRSFLDNPVAARASKVASVLPNAVRARAAHFITRCRVGKFGEVPPQSRWGKLADVLATHGRALDLYQAAYSMFTREFLHELARVGDPPCARSGLPECRAVELDALINDQVDLHAISMLELSCFIGERLLRDTDASSMAVSLEVRVPLLDHRVVEAAAGVEFERRFHPLGKKQLLRDIGLKGLDAAIFDRPKAGFELPIDMWCHRELKHELDCAFTGKQQCEAVGLNHDAVCKLWRSFQKGAPGIYWSRVWTLFVLLHWCAKHRVSL